MSITRIALLMVAPAAFAHILAIPLVIDIGSAFDVSVSQALLLAGLGGYSLVGGALAYRYASETSRAPLFWAVAVIIMPFAAPFVLGSLKNQPLPQAAPALLPEWNFEPPPLVHTDPHETLYTNPEWQLTLPVPLGWRVVAENVSDPSGRHTIVALEGERSFSGQASITVDAAGCAYAFSSEEIAACVGGGLIGGATEQLLKAYHDTYLDEFMGSVYMGHEILREGACILADAPAVMFLGSVLSPSGRMFEKQVSLFTSGGVCRCLCSMPEERRAEVEAYFDRLVHSCAPAVSTNLWSAKLLALEPSAVPLTEEARASKASSLPIITPAMLESDFIPLTLPPDSSWTREWQPNASSTHGAVSALLHIPESVSARPAALSDAKPKASAPRTARKTQPATAGTHATTATANPVREPAALQAPAESAIQSEPAPSRMPKPSDPPVTTTHSRSEPAPEQALESILEPTAQDTSGPLASWSLRKNTPEQAAAAKSPALAAQDAREHKLTPPELRAARAQAAVCSHCGKPTLSREQLLHELSSRGITLTRDNSGRLKIRTNGQKDPSEIRAVISELQQRRAFACSDCGAVTCADCLAVHAPAKTCTACQKASLVEV